MTIKIIYMNRLTYATASDFSRTSIQERTKYGIHEMPPVQSLRRSMDNLTENMKDWGSFKGFYEPRICVHMGDDPDQTECNFCNFKV